MAFSKRDIYTPYSFDKISTQEHATYGKVLNLQQSATGASMMLPINNQKIYKCSYAFSVLCVTLALFVGMDERIFHGAFLINSLWARVLLKLCLIIIFWSSLWYGTQRLGLKLFIWLEMLVVSLVLLEWTRSWSLKQVLDGDAYLICIALFIGGLMLAVAAEARWDKYKPPPKSEDRTQPPLW